MDRIHRRSDDEYSRPDMEAIYLPSLLREARDNGQAGRDRSDAHSDDIRLGYSQAMDHGLNDFAAARKDLP